VTFESVLPIWWFTHSVTHTPKGNFFILLFTLVAQKGGCMIVDSTRRGKRFPDSMSKTIPIWTCVLNRAIAQFKRDFHTDDASAPQLSVRINGLMLSPLLHFISQFLFVCLYEGLNMFFVYIKVHFLFVVYVAILIVFNSCKYNIFASLYKICSCANLVVNKLFMAELVIVICVYNIL